MSEKKAANMSDTDQAASTGQPLVTRQSVPAREQWAWFTRVLGITGAAAVIAAGIQFGYKFLLPAVFPYHSLYEGVLYSAMSVVIVVAVLTGVRRYWLPMVAFIILALVGVPLLWRGVYILFFLGK